MATQDLGRMILMKRMVSSLQQRGFRVELAEDYGGYIVAGQGEDPPVYLLDADVIEKCRLDSPGDVKGFLERVGKHVQSQLGSQGPGGRTSYPPLREAAPEMATPAMPEPEEVPEEALGSAEPAGGGGEPIDEKQAIEGESTEELSLEDFK